MLQPLCNVVTARNLRRWRYPAIEASGKRGINQIGWRSVGLHESTREHYVWPLAFHLPDTRQPDNLRTVAVSRVKWISTVLKMPPPMLIINGVISLDYYIFDFALRSHHEHESGNQGIRNQESGIRNRESGIRNQESGIRNQESGIRNQESGIRNQESGIRNQESGIRNQESGIRNQEAGIRNQESGIRNQESGINRCNSVLER